MTEKRSTNAVIREKRYEDGFRVMQGRREYVTYPDDSSVRIWYSDVPWRFDTHDHSAAEICLTLEGVVDYLVQHGVAADRLRAVGYGASRPVAPNDTPEGRAQNRRTEAKVL